MRVAVAQLSCAVGNLRANLDKIGDLCSRAKENGAELIVFPEMVDTGYAMSAIREHACSWIYGPVPVLREKAKSLSIAIVCGVSEREDAHIYNTQVCISAAGEIVGKYRKTHLFTPAPVEEHTCFTAGDAVSSLQIGSFQFGLGICYDLRFPEFYRHLAVDKRANAFAVSSAWPFPRVEHLSVLSVARAIENQSYLLLANRVGTDAGVTFCGSSAIIDPSGVTVAAASVDREELLFADFSEKLVRSVRDRMPVFSDRRPELYDPTASK